MYIKMEFQAISQLANYVSIFIPSKASGSIKLLQNGWEISCVSVVMAETLE